MLDPNISKNFTFHNGTDFVYYVLFVPFWSTVYPVVLLVIEMIINDGTYKMRSLKVSK